MQRHIGVGNSLDARRETHWKCPDYGPRFIRKISDMMTLRACPDCEPNAVRHSLACPYPEIAAEWPTTNPLTARQVRPSGQTAFTVDPSPVRECPYTESLVRRVWSSAWASMAGTHVTTRPTPKGVAVSRIMPEAGGVSHAAPGDHTPLIRSYEEGNGEAQYPLER